jgi:hypothetical protein
VTTLLLLKQLLLITNHSDGIVDLLKLIYGAQSIDGCDKEVVEAVIGQIVEKQTVPMRKVVSNFFDTMSNVIPVNPSCEDGPQIPNHHT